MSDDIFTKRAKQRDVFAERAKARASKPAAAMPAAGHDPKMTFGSALGEELAGVGKGFGGAAMGALETMFGGNPVTQATRMAASVPEMYQRVQDLRNNPTFKADPYAYALRRAPGMIGQASGQAIAGKILNPEAGGRALSRPSQAVADKLASQLAPGRISRGVRDFYEGLELTNPEQGKTALNNINIAKGDLAEIGRDITGSRQGLVNRVTGAKGAERLHDLAERIDRHSNDLWDKYHKPVIEKYGSDPVNSKAMVRAATSKLTKASTQVNSTEARAALKWIKEQDTPTDLGTLDEKIRHINDDIKSKASGKSPYGPQNIAVRKAYVQAARAEVERVLQARGEAGILQVNKRYGALRSLQDHIEKQAYKEAVNTSNKPLLPDWVHVYGFMHGFDPSKISVGMSTRLGRMMTSTASDRIMDAVKDLGKSGLKAPPVVPVGGRVSLSEVPRANRPAPSPNVGTGGVTPQPPVSPKYPAPPRRVKVPTASPNVGTGGVTPPPPVNPATPRVPPRTEIPTVSPNVGTGGVTPPPPVSPNPALVRALLARGMSPQQISALLQQMGRGQ
jgi:hypothetical protein